MPLELLRLHRTVCRVSQNARSVSKTENKRDRYMKNVFIALFALSFIGNSTGFCSENAPKDLPEVVFKTTNKVPVNMVQVVETPEYPKPLLFAELGGIFNGKLVSPCAVISEFGQQMIFSVLVQAHLNKRLTFIHYLPERKNASDPEITHPACLLGVSLGDVATMDY